MTIALFQTAALHFLNLPYLWGGDDSIKGFDCSGLVQELFTMIGIDPPGDQTAQGLYDFFKSRSRARVRCCGTLIFYGSSVTKITHVAMMLNEWTCIEAGGGGSKTLTLVDAAMQNAYCRLRPYNRRKDVVAEISPKDLPW